MAKKTIMVVDDEIRIRRMLKDFLSSNDFHILECENGQIALNTFFENAENIHLIILDVMMPQIDGYTVLKEIREYSKVPIIMLTARTEEYDQLGYYKYGADDFVAKPFSPKLLLAHINAVLNRCYPNGNSSLKAGLIELDEKKHEVLLGDTMIDLSPKEYELLYYFMCNSGIVLTRDAILDAVWGHDYDGDVRTVDTHVKQLRAKLCDYNTYIKTVHGIGYRFEVDDV